MYHPAHTAFSRSWAQPCGGGGVWVIGSPPAQVLLLGTWHVNIYITYVDKPTKIY